MIDSLDPESRQLEALLGGLRYRFADRLKAAGIQLDWQVDDLPALPWLDAPQALELLRVIHALVGHAIAEEGARHLRLAASEQGSTVTILVEHCIATIAGTISCAMSEHIANKSIQTRLQQRLHALVPATLDSKPAWLEVHDDAAFRKRQYLISIPL